LSAAQAAEAAARRSYGRLLASLAWQWRDIAAAEDALAEAFASALERWPRDGVPEAPEGWLMTAARRQLLMAARRQRLADDPTLTVLWPSEHDAAPQAAALPDSRLRLMFVCAHPAIEPSVRTALMLQTVLGLQAAQIASAFLVKPEAMMQRLVRAKAKIKSTGIRFEEPEPAEWPERLSAVLEAIYAAYTLHWGQVDDAGASELAGEALFLAELVVAHLPHEAEALGLYALLGLCEARRPARLDHQGAFIPLHAQDPARWDDAQITRAHEALLRAAQCQSPGAFQLEAAVQSAHVQGLIEGAVPWADIAQLYSQLLAMAPTIGAQIGHAVAVARSEGDAQLGLRLLDALDSTSVAAHQPWWATRAHLLADAGRHADAVPAYERAMALTVEPALRAWLALRREACINANRAN
jgi:RNA polymerase sigma-70 factor, ECF subfamily